MSKLGKRALATIESYYADPRYCLTCDHVIRVSPGQKACSVAKQKYCSSSCAAKSTNRLNQKRYPEGKCLICELAIPTSRKYCGATCRQKAKDAKKRSEIKDRSSSVVECRQRTKIKSLAYMGGKCARCSYSRCNRALHFHHCDPAKK